VLEKELLQPILLYRIQSECRRTGRLAISVAWNTTGVHCNGSSFGERRGLSVIRVVVRTIEQSTNRWLDAPTVA